MIEEIIEKIRAAEEEAANRKTAAEEEAGRIRAEANAEYTRVVEEAKKNARAARENAVALAERTAAENYAADVAEAEANGKKLVVSYEKQAVSEAENLFGRIENGDL